MSSFFFFALCAGIEPLGEHHIRNGNRPKSTREGESPPNRIIGNTTY